MFLCNSKVSHLSKNKQQYCCKSDDLTSWHSDVLWAGRGKGVWFSQVRAECLLTTETIAAAPNRSRGSSWDMLLCRNGCQVLSGPHQRVEPETLESGRNAMMARSPWARRIMSRISPFSSISLTGISVRSCFEPTRANVPVWPKVWCLK